MIFYLFWYPLFEHEICIDCSSIWGCILVSFLMFFWILQRAHMQPSKPSKIFVLQWIPMILPFRETWFLMIFPIFFVTSFGIDSWWVLVSILLPFWNPFGINFHVLGWSFSEWFFELFFGRFWSRMGPKVRGRHAPHLYILATFFRTLVSFTHVRPTSARIKVLQLFSKNKKKLSTLVPFTFVRIDSWSESKMDELRNGRICKIWKTTYIYIYIYITNV